MEAELQQILVQVSELQRRRLTPPHGPRLVDMGKEAEQVAAPPYRPLPPACSILKRLVVSPSLGGTAVTPQLTEVRRPGGHLTTRIVSEHLKTATVVTQRDIST